MGGGGTSTKYIYYVPEGRGERRRRGGIVGNIFIMYQRGGGEGLWKGWVLKFMYIKLPEYRIQNTEYREQKRMYIKLPFNFLYGAWT